MSSISSLKRRSLLLFSVIISLQVIFLPSAEAVSPWSGTPWEGTPWEGDPWEGDTIEGGSSWEGNPWEGDTSEGGSSWEGDTSEEGSTWEGNPWEGSPWDGPQISSDRLCLPLPSNDWGDHTPRNSSSVTEQEKEQIVQAIIEKDNPFNFFTSKKKRQEYEKAVGEAVNHLLDRPYGTVNDIDIPPDVLTTLADASYSDAKLNDDGRSPERTKDGYKDFLADHGWVEKESRSHSSGFHARVFVNEDDGTVAFSFGGTEGLGDGIADLGLATGWGTKQFDQADKFVEDMMKRYPGYDPVLTGHSLGGALAQYVSGLTRIPAITWNAPGIGTREFSYSDVWVEDGFWKNLGSATLKTLMIEGNMTALYDEMNRNGLFDDLAINHVMEDDEIGTYQKHLGQTRLYSDDGTVEMKYDYSKEAHHQDVPYSKIERLIEDGKNGLPSHGIGNFLDLMYDCN